MNQIRKWLIKLERWIFDDESAILSVIKLFGVIFIAAGLISISLMYLPSGSTFTLNKSEWRCESSHSETNLVLVGKMLMPVTANVCDIYVRN